MIDKLSSAMVRTLVALLRLRSAQVLPSRAEKDPGRGAMHSRAMYNRQPRTEHREHQPCKRKRERDSNHGVQGTKTSSTS